MFNVITRVCVLVSLIMTSFNSYAAAEEITGDSQTYINFGPLPLIGTPTVITLPLFPGINPIIGIYNDGNQNIITNATSGTINSSAGDDEQAFGIASILDSNTLTNSGTITATAGDNGKATGIYFYGDSNITTNSGNITTTARDNGLAFGIYSYGDRNTITNTGTITATTGGWEGDGIRAWGDRNTITNSGTITVTAWDNGWGSYYGIQTFGNNDIITNSGTIAATAGDNGQAYGIYSKSSNFGDNTITNTIITNSGTIAATAGDNGQAYGIYSKSSNFGDNTITNTIITNSGTIAATAGGNGGAFGIYSEGIGTTISNSGNITATATVAGVGVGAGAYGINSQGDSNTITNFGNINATAGDNGGAFGIYSEGIGTTISNSGNITATATVAGVGVGAGAAGITSLGNGNTITNSGNITATAVDDEVAIGIWSFGDSNTITNSGTITSTVERIGLAVGILYEDNNNTITNSGTINATAGVNGGALGINSLGNGNTITNSGTITATAGDSGQAYGIVSDGDSNIITNSGTITASGGAGSTAVAIQNYGILTSLTNSGTISGPVAIDSTFAGASIGTITNSGTINGDINVAGQDVTILGGSGSKVGALTGGTITLTSGKNLTFGSGSQLLADNINVGTGTVTNEGSLYLNSTQSITGSYAQTSTSTYNSSVDGQLNVSDTANLTGTFNATGGNGINGNTRWTVLTATNGLNGSTFSSVTSDLDLVNFALAYDANDVSMTAQANYTSAATNQNQLAVASSLQSAFYSSPSTAGQSVLDKINPMSAPQAQAAFNALSGEGLSAQQTANFSATNLVVDASRRQANYWLMDECQRGASANNNKQSRHNVLPASCSSTEHKRFRSWLSGVGASDSLDGSSSMGSASVSTQTGGGVVGFDYEVNSHLLVGGMVGGTASNYNVSARSSTGTDSSGQVGLYSVAKWNNFYVNGIFNYGYFSGDTKRYVNGLASTAEQTGKTSSNAFTGRAEVGYRMDHPLVNVMPFVAMQATSLQMNSFNESNTNNLGLAVAGNTTMSEPGSLGVQLDHSFDISDKWTLYPLLRMAWVHEFQTDRSVNASLQALPTSNWTVNGASAASNAANIGITVQAMSKHGVAVFASGNTETSSSTQSYMGELGVKWLF